MNLLKRILRYCHSYGVESIFRTCSYYTLGVPKELAVCPPNAHHPVRLRIGTTDRLIYRQVLLQGEYDFDMSFCPMTILDAGANIGTTSIYFAQKYPGARIVALEPEISNFSVLTRNVRPYSAVTPIRAALWNSDGEINVCEPRAFDGIPGVADKWGYSTSQHGMGMKARSVTMDSLMRETGIPSFDLVKIDIEGAEIEAFSDTKWLRGVRCLMIELHDRLRPGCTEIVNRAMMDDGFISSSRGETVIYTRSLC